MMGGGGEPTLFFILLFNLCARDNFMQSTPNSPKKINQINTCLSAFSHHSNIPSFHHSIFLMVDFIFKLMYIEIVKKISIKINILRVFKT